MDMVVFCIVMGLALGFTLWMADDWRQQAAVILLVVLAFMGGVLVGSAL